MAPSDLYLFPNLNFHLLATQYRSNEGVIEAINEYFGDQENAFYFEGLRTLEQRIALPLREIKLKSYGQIFILW